MDEDIIEREEDVRLDSHTVLAILITLQTLKIFRTVWHGGMWNLDISRTNKDRPIDGSHDDGKRPSLDGTVTYLAGLLAFT